MRETGIIGVKAPVSHLRWDATLQVGHENDCNYSRLPHLSYLSHLAAHVYARARARVLRARPVNCAPVPALAAHRRRFWWDRWDMWDFASKFNGLSVSHLYF